MKAEPSHIQAPSNHPHDRVQTSGTQTDFMSKNEEREASQLQAFHSYSVYRGNRNLESFKYCLQQFETCVERTCLGQETLYILED